MGLPSGIQNLQQWRKLQAFENQEEKYCVDSEQCGKAKDSSEISLEMWIYWFERVLASFLVNWYPKWRDIRIQQWQRGWVRCLADVEGEGVLGFKDRE